MKQRWNVTAKDKMIHGLSEKELDLVEFVLQQLEIDYTVSSDLWKFSNRKKKYF